MAKSLRELMSGKSDKGLTEYLDNFKKYTPEAITAAADELKRRGRNFSEEELEEINSKIENRGKSEDEEDNPFFISNSWKKYVVTNPNAPLLYSKGAIRGFSFFFSAIFGAALLSSNIENAKRKWIVIAFGILYTALTGIIVSFIPRNIFWASLLNTAGGLGLTSTFWDKYIGKEIEYRSKAIWKPLIISIIITIPFLIAIIYG